MQIAVFISLEQDESILLCGLSSGTGQRMHQNPNPNPNPRAGREHAGGGGGNWKNRERGEDRTRWQLRGI